MMTSFNLIDSPWIPIRWRDEAEEPTRPLVSLAEAFTRSHEIADLDCRPHERIALTRLLVCLTHAALGAPEYPDEWTSGNFAAELDQAVPAYLVRPEIHPHFELFGPGPRFLQEEVPAQGDPIPTSKLFPQLATGNNPTLLDHAGMEPNRDYPPARLALGLLTFQNFYPLYGAGYKGRGPCADGNALHCLLGGPDLHAQIRANLLDLETIENTALEGLGRPIWECTTPDDLLASTRTLLGRLVPRHRSLRLRDDGTGFHLRKQSLEYPNWEPQREPSTSLRLHKKNKNDPGQRRLVAARAEKGIWRDLHYLTALRLSLENNRNSAPVLLSHADELDEGEVTLWTGALLTDLKAKILDTLESTFTLPATLFQEDGHSVYQKGVEHAELISQKLYGAVKNYGTSLMHDKPPTTDAQALYWHRLDQQHRGLIELARHPDRHLEAIGSRQATDSWTRAVRNAAREAYEAACPAATPRQLQAHANGLRILLSALYPKSDRTPSPAATA